MPTTIKDALKNWQEKHGDTSLAEAKEVGLQFQWPPIEKMDNSLSVLTSVEKLSLSTNMIEKIQGLNTLKNLKILALGRNYIKTFSGLEGVSDTLQELWISYNFIEKMKGIGVLKNLKVLYMSNNLVKDWSEFKKLDELPILEDLLFVGNPLHDNVYPQKPPPYEQEGDMWRAEVVKRLPNLKKLDGEPVVDKAT